MTSWLASLYSQFRSLSIGRKVVWSTAVFIGLTVLVLSQFPQRATKDHRPAIEQFHSSQSEPQTTAPSIDLASNARITQMTPSPGAPQDISTTNLGIPGTPASPRIEHAAEIALATKEFSRSRSSLEDIIDRHHGYTAKLRMLGEPTGSSLSATIRVPAWELAKTLAELKTLGRVEHEEQSADEVTMQRADFDARWANAQDALKRLQARLQDFTVKDYEYSEIQRQIAQLRGQIEWMKAERRAVETRVMFSNVQFSMREEREVPVETLSAQLRSALATGLGDALASFSGILLVVASHGPMLLLWGLLLFLPARFVWRRWSRMPARVG
jgi:hypothetical protein